MNTRKESSNVVVEQETVEGVPSDLEQLEMSYTHMKLRDVDKCARKYFDKVGLN